MPRDIDQFAGRYVYLASGSDSERVLTIREWTAVADAQPAVETEPDAIEQPIQHSDAA